MLNFETKPQDKALDEAISSIFAAMVGMDEASDEYAKASDQLVKLMKLKKEINPSWRPSPDALIGALGSFLGIIAIINFYLLREKK